MTVVILLFMIGVGHDAWRCFGPRPRPLAMEGLHDARDAPALSPADGGDEASRPRAAVPAPENTPGADGARSSPRPALAESLDLNRASAAELDLLPGIGPVLAQRIVDHRTRHGPFRRVDELLAVRGIGPRLLERLTPHLRIGPPPARE